jgi:hypothetical protein
MNSLITMLQGLTDTGSGMIFRFMQWDPMQTPMCALKTQELVLSQATMLIQMEGMD